SNECPVRPAIATITGWKWTADEGYSSSEWAIRRLIHKMRQTGHGGIVALLPQPPTDAITKKIAYRRTDPGLLANRIRAEWDALSATIASAVPLEGKVDVEDAMEAAEKRAAYEQSRDAIESALDDIAQLSAVDGAVLIGPGLAVLGAGYLIRSNS